MNKKEKENYVLHLFIKEYNSSISVLTIGEAQKIFPAFNGENPDFIIKFNEELIGIELFELTPDKFHTGIDGIQNNAHFVKKIDDLIEIPDITDASIGQINKKMNKLPIYVTPKIWLLGYAIEFYNAFALKPAIDDRFLKQYVKGILDNITINPRVEKIFLLERMSHNLLIDILDASSYEDHL